MSKHESIITLVFNYVNTKVLIEPITFVFMKTLAERLSWARQKKKMSQAQLAEKASVSQSTIGNLEAGLRLTSRNPATLAKALGVNALWLETGKGKPDLDHVEPQQVSTDYSDEIEEVIKLMLGTDADGRTLIKIKVKEIASERNSYLQKILTNSINLPMETHAIISNQKNKRKENAE